MKDLDWKSLTALEGGWACVACCPKRDIDDFVGTLPEHGVTVARIICGNRCPTEKALFQEFAAAFQFPYYFGANWDALEECINDLEWLRANAYVLFLTHADRVLEGADKKFRILLQILRDSAQEWALPKEDDPDGSIPPTPFRVVFQCEPDAEFALRGRLRAAGL